MDLTSLFGRKTVQKRSHIEVITYSSTPPQSAPPTITDFLHVYSSHPWVYVCVDVIARSVASVPFSIYRDGKEDKESDIARLFTLINPYTTQFDFWYRLVTDLEVTGNYFAEIEFSNGKPVALHPMCPANVTIVPDPVKRVKAYEYTANGMTVSLPADKVIHLYFPSPVDPFWGMSPLMPLMSSLVTDIYARNYNKTFFENNAQVDAVLETDEIITKEDADTIREMWQRAYSGPRKHHSVAVLWGGLKYKDVGTKPKDANFLELTKAIRDEILAVYGVPPAVVGVYEYSNYANARAQYKAFWANTVGPLIMKLEQMINEFIISRFSEGLVGRFQTEKVTALIEEEMEQVDIDAKLVETGLATINERRALRGLPPVEWGDTWHRPLNKEEWRGAQRDNSGETETGG